MSTDQIADRALVDLAAKAAGIDGASIVSFGGFPGIDVGTLSPWLPLHKDSDAFSLLVKLSMHVHVDDDTNPRGVVVLADSAERIVPVPVRVWLPIAADATGEEKRAIVRRAIVLAAAELGVAK